MRPVVLKHILYLALLSARIHCSAQSHCSPSYERDSLKGRKTFLMISTPVVYTGYLIGLNELWYKQSPRSKFHFFNDNPQWLQMDKVGHFYGAYQYSRAGVKVLEWAGLEHRKAVIWGSLTGFIFQTPVEILDGFQKDFGASWGDLVANTAGSGAVLSQYMLWDEIRIHPKFSFHRTGYSNLRPSVLGAKYNDELFKDYNGQTYWLSGNISSFLPGDTKFPKWLNFAVGYSGDNMIYGRRNENITQGYGDHRRQYYLSIDFELSKIQTSSKFLKTMFFIFQQIKVPFPALEFSRNGLSFKPLYF